MQASLGCFEKFEVILANELNNINGLLSFITNLITDPTEL